MNLPLQLQTYQCSEQRLQLYVPQHGAVQREYKKQKEIDPATPFPYWTQVWPAAIALANFLADHSQYIKNKKVLELAAGLGLPSMVAAHYAQAVCCTDYLEEAVAVVKKSVTINGLQNVTCRVINWHHLPKTLSADVLLLSDINYNPDEFNVLLNVLQYFLNKGTTLLLSTPQRLVAKSFIEQLTPWCRHQQQVPVLHYDETINVSILVLKAECES
jgi:methyltransferase-like protein 23